jgi:hypothetical protein
VRAALAGRRIVTTVEGRLSACKNRSVTDPDWPEEERVERAIQEARSLGWSLHVDKQAGEWSAWGAPSIPGTGVFARDLPGGVSQVEAAEAGMAAIQQSAGVSRRDFGTRASPADAAEVGLAAIRDLVERGGSRR